MVVITHPAVFCFFFYFEGLKSLPAVITLFHLRCLFAKLKVLLESLHNEHGPATDANLPWVCFTLSACVKGFSL